MDESKPTIEEMSKALVALGQSLFDTFVPLIKDIVSAFNPFWNSLNKMHDDDMEGFHKALISPGIDCPICKYRQPKLIVNTVMLNESKMEEIKQRFMDKKYDPITLLRTDDDD